jgi:hypothetical protein
MFLLFVVLMSNGLYGIFCQYISPNLIYFLNLFLGILQNMPISISRHPIAIAVVEIFKSKSLTVSRQCPEQPFHPDLVLTFALGYFSSWESFVANSSIELLTQDKIWFGVSLISYIQSSLRIPVLYLCLAPFLGSLMVLQFQHGSLIFGKSTVLDSAQPFW